MIVGIGFDIVEIARIRRTCEEYGDRFLHRVFTERERAYAAAKSDPFPSLAARFAAKEALVKATREGKFHSFNWQEAEVTIDSRGVPSFRLSGALERFLRNRRIHISLSHADSYATAAVVIEGV